jgi:hypothetical protein
VGVDLYLGRRGSYFRGTDSIRGGFGGESQHSSYELAHTLGRDFSMKNDTVAHEGGIVLELCANIRNVKGAIDF